MNETKTRGPNKLKPNDLSVHDFLDRLAELADDRMFSEHHAAAMLDMAVGTIREERAELVRLWQQGAAEVERAKEGMVPWIRVGATGVRYRLGDLREFQRRQRFGGGVAPNVVEIYEPEIDTEGIGLFVGRFADGRLPFSVLKGAPQDFIDTADEDVDSIEWMLPEEAAILRETGCRLAVD